MKSLKSIGLGLGFVLFSGVSIIPRVIRLDDVVMRLAAAVYLRRFSPHFRLFSKGQVAEMVNLPWKWQNASKVMTLFWYFEE